MDYTLDVLNENYSEWKHMALTLQKQAQEWEPERAQLVAQVQAAESERDQARAERDEARAMLETIPPPPDRHAHITSTNIHSIQPAVSNSGAVHVPTVMLNGAEA
jgi:hypothetical protein